MEEIGNVILNGRYQIISFLGEGASSKVYHAYDTAIARDVVLKVFHLGTSGA